MNEDVCGRRTPVQPDKEPMSLTSLMYLAVYGWLSKTDGMRMPVSGGMRYAPKLSTRSKRKEIKETGNEED
jgi:hypothetical protein